MFWGDPHVTMLHQSYAPRVLSGHGGVWALFFGNPQCGPCRRTAPHVRRFAREFAAHNGDWLKVGTVNMAVGSNGNMLQHFGNAARGIPQVILVAPSSGGGGGGGGTTVGLQSRLSDFEVFDKGDLSDGRDFSSRLFRACERLRASAVPALPVPTSATTIAAAVGEAQRNASGPDADPGAKWAVLAVDGSGGSAGLLAVFRRLSEKLRHGGFVLRVLHCEGGGDGNAAGDGACGNDVGSLPELRLYGPRRHDRGEDPSPLLALDPSGLLDGASSDARRYGYGIEQTGFAVLVEAAFLTSTPVAEERFPSSVIVGGASRSAFLNGTYRLIGTTNGRPLYKKSDDGVYLRWLTPGQRSTGEGAWILSDTPEPADRGWAFMVEDRLVPISGGGGWNLLAAQGTSEFRIEAGMAVSNGEDWAVQGAGSAARDEL